MNRNVFLIYGHNRATLREVELAVHGFGLDPAILGDKPNEGLTIIEKLEKQSTASSYAIGILTG